MSVEIERSESCGRGGDCAAGVSKANAQIRNLEIYTGEMTKRVIGRSTNTGKQAVLAVIRVPGSVKNARKQYFRRKWAGNSYTLGALAATGLPPTASSTDRRPGVADETILDT